MPDRIVREPERYEVTGLSPSTCLRLEQADQFPRRIKLGPRAVGWLESQLQAWIRERAGLPDDTDTEERNVA